MILAVHFFFIFSTKRYNVCVMEGAFYYRGGRLVSICERVEYWQISGEVIIPILEGHTPLTRCLRV